LWGWKKINVKRKEYIVDVVDVFPMNRILMQHRRWRQRNRNTMAYTPTPDHNIQSMMQSMTRPSVPASTSAAWWVATTTLLTDWCIYVFPYTHTRLMLHKLIQCFLKKKFIGVREESRVWKWDFRNFQEEERMNVI